MGGVLNIVTSHVPSLVSLVQRARTQGEVIDDRPRARGGETAARSVPAKPAAAATRSAPTVEVTSGSQAATAAPLPTPTTAAAEEAPATATDDIPANEGLDILIATDSAIEMKVLSRKLQSLGHRVTGATDGRTALEIALKTAPQLILSDWMLPKLDGLELCRMLRLSPQTQGVYFIINTSNDTGEDLIAGFDAGINDYVVKPLNHRILAARLRGATQVIRLREQSLRDREEMRKQISQINVLNRKLDSLAMEDQLTGLPNRRAGLEFLEEQWARASRTGDPMLVMMLDIDHFKKVNDTYGHDGGDVVLRRTATAMRSAVRDYDKVSRYGGEEFLVVCPGADINVAFDVGNRIRLAVERNRIESDVFTGSITISIGVSVRHAGHKSTRDMLHDADEALYAAKDAGRNKVCIQSGVEA
jgi:diguanylate cyclase (GGDEF)-like protein